MNTIIKILNIGLHTGLLALVFIFQDLGQEAYENGQTGMEENIFPWLLIISWVGLVWHAIALYKLEGVSKWWLLLYIAAPLGWISYIGLILKSKR